MNWLSPKFGIGDGAGVVVAGEHGAGDGGHQPVAVGEAGLREDGAGGLTSESRCTCQAPPERASPGAAGLGRTATAASPDFQFAEDVAFGRGGLGHEHADIAGGGGLREFDVGGVERVQGRPGFGIVGDLQCAFGGAADPGERDAVEGADWAPRST